MIDTKKSLKNSEHEHLLSLIETDRTSPSTNQLQAIKNKDIKIIKGIGKSLLPKSPIKSINVKN